MEAIAAYSIPHGFSRDPDLRGQGSSTSRVDLGVDSAAWRPGPDAVCFCGPGPLHITPRAAAGLCQDRRPSLHPASGVPSPLPRTGQSDTLQPGGTYPDHLLLESRPRHLGDRQLRKCGNCYKDLPSSSFRENPRAHDGLHPNCISCQDTLAGKRPAPKLARKALSKKPEASDRADKKKLPWTTQPKRNRR